MSADMNMEGIELMGNNLRAKVKYCGEGVRLYPLCKMIHPTIAELDDHCQIFDFVFIDAGTKFQLGKYSTLTWHTLIEGGSDTVIGDRVFIGPGTKVLNSTYRLDEYYTVEHLPGDCNVIDYASIKICDDAYIGASCTILPGSYIGEGAVVGSNSLVKGKLEPWTVYVGTPCKPIRKRIPPTEERNIQLQEIDWTKHF